MTGWPDPKEMRGYHFWRRLRRAILRVLKRQLELERKYAEKRFEKLVHALSAEMEFREQRVIDRLEEIDTSISLIAQEIARRDGDLSSDGVGD